MSISKRDSKLRYDLVILDWDLPGINGVDILRQLRMRGDTTPVLLVCAGREGRRLGHRRR